MLPDKTCSACTLTATINAYNNLTFNIRNMKTLSTFDYICVEKF